MYKKINPLQLKRILLSDYYSPKFKFLTTLKVIEVKSAIQSNHTFNKLMPLI
jgi:hypothetical protein